MTRTIAGILGKTIHKMRAERQLSLTKAAGEAQISRAQWSKIESGQHWPSERYLLRICGVLNICPSDVFFSIASSLYSLECAGSATLRGESGKETD